MKNKWVSQIALLFRSSAEGKLLALVLGASIFSVVCVFPIRVFSPGLANELVAMTIAQFTLGRLAAMSLGYAMDVHFFVLLLINLYLETLLILGFYSGFVLIVTQLPQLHFVVKYLDKAHAAAVRYQPLIRKLGPWGLFLFVWIPFWMTGPLVGCILGYLLRFPIRATLISVVLGNHLSVIIWAMFLYKVDSVLTAINPRAGMMLFIGLVIAGIFIKLVQYGYQHFTKERNHV